MSSVAEASSVFYNFCIISSYGCLKCLWPPSLQAAWYGLLPLVEKLLAAGADPQALDSARLTPLHAAISAGLPLDRMQPVITAIAKACPALLEPSWAPSPLSSGAAAASAGGGHQGGGSGTKSSLKTKGVRDCIPKQNKKLRELIDKVTSSKWGAGHKLLSTYPYPQLQSGST